MNVSWPSPEYDRQIDLICDKLKGARNIFCIAHPYADGDALGSQLALYHWCLSAGKNCVVLNFDALPEQISWLPGANRCRADLPEDINFDLAFLMETTEARRMGERVEFFKRAATTVHLDHHIGVTGLGTINILEEKASSTCEILYNILERTGIELSRDCREALYVGIMTDTGNFRFNNSTPRAHEVAARLIGNDLVVDDIYKIVYENTNYLRVVIHGTVMARARSFNDGKVVASWLALDDFTRTGAAEVDADGAIRNLSCIKGIEAALLFKEVEGGKIKVSFRSTGQVDVMEISRKFNGGGHRNASGAQIDGSLEEVMHTVVSAVAAALPPGEICNA
ncbi:MAG: bifunctional oligoribonuclease/PAP phosphatase NrnA [Candidatus Riflebacteria bacterium]|nr:bifunctional oligoribonuclease/PAP phosphatase NrnA [Candidatus Riflebacteria bacterium]